jgi:hypothetical protein
VVSTTDPYGLYLGFLTRSRYFFFQVAPQLYSRGSGPRSRPTTTTTTTSLVAPGIEPETSGSVARSSDH